MAEENKENGSKVKEAHELFDGFTDMPIVEFFKNNRQMLGLTGKFKTLTMLIHELVSNALDACDESGILPEVAVDIKKLDEEYYRITVADNGPGIPTEFIPKVFCSMLAGTKFKNSQTRGQQGIGAAGVALYAQMSTGKPIEVVSVFSKKGKKTRVDMVLSTDVKKNVGKIESVKEQEAGSGESTGVKVVLEVKGVACNKGSQGPFEYLRRTAISNPHAKIKYTDPDREKINFKRAIDLVPKFPSVLLPHPKGVESHNLLTMAHASEAKKLRTFLLNDFCRLSNAKIDELQKKTGFDFNKVPKSLEWHEAEKIVKAFQQMDFIAPPTEGIVPIGEQYITKALKNIIKPSFVTARTRKPLIYRGGIPVIIEVALAYGGSSIITDKGLEEGGAPATGQAEVMRFANRSPLLFDAGACAITKAVNTIDWKRYEIKDMSTAPLTVFVHVVSARIPYTSTGKTAISDEEELVNEIRLALMDAGRDLSKYMHGILRERNIVHKRKTIERYIPEVAGALADLTGEIKSKIEKMLVEMMNKKYLVSGEEVGEKEEEGGQEGAVEEDTEGERDE